MFNTTLVKAAVLAIAMLALTTGVDGRASRKDKAAYPEF